MQKKLYLINFILPTILILSCMPPIEKNTEEDSLNIKFNYFLYTWENTHTTADIYPYVYDVYESNSIIYVATLKGLFISKDAGSSWTNYTTNNGIISNNINDVYVTGSKIYLATTSGLSISNDGGSTWTNYFKNNSVRSVYAIDSTIYAAANGLFVSTDNSLNWTNYTTSNGLGDNHINCIYISDSVIYAGTMNGLSISNNNGLNWNNFLSNYVVIDVFVLDSKIYVITRDEGFFISINNGLSWKNYFNSKNLTCSFASGSEIYIAGYNGLYVSKNNGSSWYSYSLNGIYFYDIYKSGSIIYASTNDGVLKIW